MASIINAGTTSNTALNMSADTSGTLDLQSNGTTMASVTSTGFNIGGAVASGFTMKNRIINGDMVIDQRNNGASVSTTPTDAIYTLDRWQAAFSTATRYTAQQNAGSVTPPAGFTNYLGVTSLAATSVGSSDYYFLQQIIEGFNVADLAWGTANARTVTLSFWVRSSLTGTFGGALTNSGQNRSYPFSYTISSANTWTQISITIPGDTSGTWLTNNGAGIRLRLGLGVGSTFSGTAGSWSGSNFFSTTGATSVVGTNGATFYITGVQLERGSQATSFEWLPYTTELQLCQRYYVRTHNSSTPYVQFAIGRAYSTTNGTANVILPVSMRTTPTLGYTTPVSGNFDYSATALASSGFPGNINNVYSVNITGGFSSGQAFALAAANVSTYVYMDFSAEL